jgi:hypothetical protein
MDTITGYILSPTVSGEVHQISINGVVADFTISGVPWNDVKTYIDGSLNERDTSIAWLNSNTLKSADLAPYATNASIGAAAFAKNSSIGGIAGKNFWTGTDASYLALGSYDSNTIYFTT